MAHPSPGSTGRVRLDLADPGAVDGRTMDTLTSVADVLAEAAASVNAAQSPHERLMAVVGAAVGTIPGFQEASVTLGDGRRVETTAASSALVQEMDERQYAVKEGPCFQALLDPGIVMVPSVRHEQRWPGYIREAIKAGVATQMAVHLNSGGGRGGVSGALNLYGTLSEGIDPEAPGIAMIFATQAALALGWAQTEEHLGHALGTRKVIGQAIGILMERYQISEEQAFAFLARVSSTSNIKLRAVASELVTQADTRYTTKDG
jgi:hypothetical protein